MRGALAPLRCAETSGVGVSAHRFRRVFDHLEAHYARAGLSTAPVFCGVPVSGTRLRTVFAGRIKTGLVSGVVARSARSSRVVVFMRAGGWQPPRKRARLYCVVRSLSPCSVRLSRALSGNLASCGSLALASTSPALYARYSAMLSGTAPRQYGTGIPLHLPLRARWCNLVCAVIPYGARISKRRGV